MSKTREINSFLKSKLNSFSINVFVIASLFYKVGGLNYYDTKIIFAKIFVV